MAHIYFSFDFGTDEEKAQQARHKLDVWKQAFRLDKKMVYKFERESDEETDEEMDETAGSDAAEESGTKTGKGKAGKEKEGAGNVRLYLRLAFSGHEKMTEDRLLKKFPAEEPFREMKVKPVREADAEFADLESKFDSLD